MALRSPKRSHTPTYILSLSLPIIDLAHLRIQLLLKTIFSNPMVLFLDQCFSILEHTCIHSRVGLSITFPRYSIEKCFLSCLSSSCESRWPGKQRTDRWATTYAVWKGNNMYFFFSKNMVNIYVLNQPAGPPTAPTAKPGCRPARRGAGRGCQRSAGKRGPGTIQGGVRFAKYA